MTDRNRFLVIDPGGATGFALYWESQANPGQAYKERWSVQTARGFDEAAKLIERYVGGWLPNRVICEDFIISANTAKKSQDGKVSIELIGVARYLCLHYDVPFELQTPSDAKNFTTKDKLERLGLTRSFFVGQPGDHALAATRHLVLALIRHGVIDASRVLPRGE